MKGYKAFNQDWTCFNIFQYEVGKAYIMNDNIEPCKSGFHFCRVPIDVCEYYHKNNDEYAEIYAFGKIIEDGNKCVCNKIKIIRELSYQ
jgi:hypothetical protein